MLEKRQTAKDSCHAVLHDNGTNIKKKKKRAFNDCNVHSLGCLAKPCRCALMMLYLKTKTVHVEIDQCKLNGGF